jgi:hypothetical protein
LNKVDEALRALHPDHKTEPRSDIDPETLVKTQLAPAKAEMINRLKESIAQVAPILLFDVLASTLCVNSLKKKTSNYLLMLTRGRLWWITASTMSRAPGSSTSRPSTTAQTLASATWRT